MSIRTQFIFTMMLYYQCQSRHNLSVPWCFTININPDTTYLCTVFPSSQNWFLSEKTEPATLFNLSVRSATVFSRSATLPPPLFPSLLPQLLCLSLQLLWVIPTIEIGNIRGWILLPPFFVLLTTSHLMTGLFAEITNIFRLHCIDISIILFFIWFIWHQNRHRNFPCLPHFIRSCAPFLWLKLSYWSFSGWPADVPVLPWSPSHIAVL